MSEPLSRPEQILMWELFAAGGAKLLKDIMPRPKGTHAALAGRGLLRQTRHGQTRLLELQDSGWRWIADCEPFPIAEGETRVTAERRLLQSLAQGIKRYAAANGKTIQDLFRVEPQAGPAPASRSKPEKTKTKTRAKADGVPPDPGSAASEAGRDLPGEIRDAFFALAGRPAREGVRLGALRARLPHVARAKLDEALLAMRGSGAANLMNLDNPRDIEGEKEAELRSGRQVFHVLWIEA